LITSKIFKEDLQGRFEEYPEFIEKLFLSELWTDLVAAFNVLEVKDDAFSKKNVPKDFRPVLNKPSFAKDTACREISMVALNYNAFELNNGGDPCKRRSEEGEGKGKIASNCVSLIADAINTVGGNFKEVFIDFILSVSLTTPRLRTCLTSVPSRS